MLISKPFLPEQTNEPKYWKKDREYPHLPPLELLRYIHDTPSKRLHEMYGDRIKDHESYRTCSCEMARIIRERMNKEPMDEEIRLSGPFANMKEEDYRTIFNHHVGVVKKMSNEELIQHRIKLQKAIKQLRIRDAAALETENERVVDMDRAEREEYRRKSNAYKPVVREEEESASSSSPRIRRSAASPEDKAVKALMAALGMTAEEAKEFIAKKKGAN
jgi:hypothetical protein